MYNNPYVIETLVALAVVGYISLCFVLPKDLSRSQKRSIRLIVLRATAVFIFLAGSLLGWYRSHSIVLSVLVPLVVFFVLLGSLQYLIRRPKHHDDPPADHRTH
ncbi:MAG: hypothetical protein HY340_02445 [Candidatus Kerfeldbacteria bacterium]|nr:hypothetical protein [Candidatus Kerfeldbacteria bacterium]